MTKSFTHVDPFEDTESLLGRLDIGANCFGFTHVDPFEDTESLRPSRALGRYTGVSPTSIRSRILKAGEIRGRLVGNGCGFTHVDPFEDTESFSEERKPPALRGFTHVDPFEDTERRANERYRRNKRKSFTHVDPFEDTESFCYGHDDVFCDVSPTSIRSRILKGCVYSRCMAAADDVSPTSIRSRILKVYYPYGSYLDAESVSPTSIRSRILKVLITKDAIIATKIVSPTSIRSRILKDVWPLWIPSSTFCFTHVDPFEDTERCCTSASYAEAFLWFHPRRSVRGY